jgi:hypothetical protein
LNTPSPPLGQAAVAVNPTTSYAYVLAHARYPYPNANLMVINETEMILPHQIYLPLIAKERSQ